jgi:glycosyltransferase involved in cell wall biosynthesis
MKVCIGIPTYNRATLLAKTLDSILPIATQIDIHVFDNNSSDETKLLAEKYSAYGIHFHWCSENLGFVGNMNRILAMHTDYDWVGVLHSDDIYLIDNAASLLDQLASHAGAGLLYGACAVANEIGVMTKAGVLNDRTWRAGEEALARCQGQIACSATYYSSSAIAQVGFFDKRFAYCADEEFNARIARKFDIVEVPIALAAYRKHEGHLMTATWRKPDFISQFLSMKLLMDSYLPLNTQQGERKVKRGVGRVLLGHASGLYARHEDDTVRSFYRYVWFNVPEVLLESKFAFRALVHHLPLLGRWICKRYSINQG